jgi:hypothetical protein
MPSAKALFPLGHVVATPAALAALETAGERPAGYLNRHLTGDWGDVDQAAWKANDRAVRVRDRLLSAYTLGSGEKLWIITEGNRSATTLLLPADD